MGPEVEAVVAEVEAAVEAEAAAVAAAGRMAGAGPRTPYRDNIRR